MADLEALGGVATGGLIPSQVASPAGKAGEHHAQCADCGTETVGRFCHNCGNPSHVHRTLVHLGEELLHGVMHFDSRTWRTLPLLAFRPGRLTREWCLGKRARYVSPLALFLFTIFVLFMGLSYFPGPKQNLMEARLDASQAVNAALANVAKVEAAQRASPPADPSGAARRLAQARIQLEAAQAAQARLSKMRGEDTWPQQLAAMARDSDLDISTGNKALDEKVRHKLENPELALYKLEQTFYKFSFLLIPISIPFVAVLFLWKRGFTLYDHGVFVLYSMTFMSMLLMAAMALARSAGPVAGAFSGLLPLIVPAHMLFQLKGAYGLGWFSALWRTGLLLVFAGVSLALFALSVVLLGLI